MKRLVRVSKGAVLHTEAWGEPVKGTVVLVMGATASMVWWPESLMTLLSDAGYRAIRFDLRDTGESTKREPGQADYDLGDMATDILAILDAYGCPSGHLVGMSLGGLLGQMVALRHRDRILSLTLIASEPVGLTYQGEGLSPAFLDHFNAMSTLDWSDQDAVSDFLVESARLSAGTAAPFDADCARRRAKVEMARTTNIQSAFNHGTLSGDLTGLNAAHLASPLLVIHGTADPIIAVDAGRTIAKVVPDARIIELEGRGHELLEQDVPTMGRAILSLADSVQA